MIQTRSAETWSIAERIADLQEMQESVMTFAKSLWDDDGNFLTEFHFGCNDDRIVWDDQAFEGFDTAPTVIVSIDVEEMSQGLCAKISPEGIHRLIFSGPHREVVVGALMTALSLERERAAKGTNASDDLARIRNQLLIARMGIYANWQTALAASNLQLVQGVPGSR